MFEVDLKILIIFIVFQFVNVILSTVKTIVVAKSKSKLLSGAVNAISYGINAIVVKYTYFIDVNLLIAIAVITNFIGAPIGQLLADIFKKDSLYIFNATVKCAEKEIIDLKNKLREKEIQCTYIEIVYDKIYEFKMYSADKETSRYLKAILNEYKAKYHILTSI